MSSLTTMGFAEPNGTGRIWIAFVEATIGLGLVALLISYLPTIYSAYNGREKGTNRLRPIAGSPPSATEFLQSLQRLGSLDSPELWRNSADWMLDLEQTHTAFPILTLLPRDPTPTIRGSPPWGRCSTRLHWSSPSPRSTSATVFADVEKGPLTVLVYGLPLIVRIARAVNVPLPPPTRLPELMARVGPACLRRSASAATSTTRPWRPCRGSSSSSRAGRRRRGAASPGSAPPTSPRSAPWPGSPRPLRRRGRRDRPATVGKPRFVRRRPLRVDWSSGRVPALATDAERATGG